MLTCFRTTEEFQRDLNLMFFNAIMYNSSDHAVYALTLAMWRDTERIIREYLNTQVPCAFQDCTPAVLNVFYLLGLLVVSSSMACWTSVENLLMLVILLAGA